MAECAGPAGLRIPKRRNLIDRQCQVNPEIRRDVKDFPSRDVMKRSGTLLLGAAGPELSGRARCSDPAHASGPGG